MKLKGIIGAFILTLFLGTTLKAQDSTAISDCAKYKSLYFTYLKQNQYADAAYFWTKAILACDDSLMDGKFYVNGRVIYTKLLADSANVARSKELNDTLIMIYEKRMLLVDDPAWTSDYVVKLINDKSTDYEKIDRLFEKCIHVSKENGKANAIKLYFQHLIMNKFNLAPNDKQEEIRGFIVEEYIVLTGYLGLALEKAKAANDENEVKRIDGAQTFLDKNFLKVANDCTVLETVFDKKLNSLPADSATKMKQIKAYLALMDLKECQSTVVYGKYVDSLILLAPSADAYFFGYNYSVGNNNTTKALKYLDRAIELEGNGPNKDKYFYALASQQYKAGSYKAAFNTALKVGSGEYKGEAYMICANAIAATANGCGASTYERKANYWLANDYVRKAIAAGKTDVGSDRFLSSAPTSTDIFNEGVSMGTSHYCSCWGESTTVR
jgi:tetratricopeptide (TPR) repeat protein